MERLEVFWRSYTGSYEPIQIDQLLDWVIEEFQAAQERAQETTQKTEQLPATPSSFSRLLDACSGLLQKVRKTSSK